MVGTRGTLRHALYLGLIVTATHTAGVYLLGAVTLYLSHYIVPERLYPWLGGISGLLITSLGCGLFLRRYGDKSQAHTHIHSHAHHLPPPPPPPPMRPYITTIPLLTRPHRLSPQERRQSPAALYWP